LEKHWTRLQRLTTAREAGADRPAPLRTKVHAGGAVRCKRCHWPGLPPESAIRQSIAKVWAGLIAGIIAFIPANIYPMLITNTLPNIQKATILGGVVQLGRAPQLWHRGHRVCRLHHDPGSAKFFAIAYLAISDAPAADIEDAPAPQTI